MTNVLIIELGGSHIEVIYSIIRLMDIKKCPVHFIGNHQLLPLLPEPEKMAGIAGVADVFSFSEQLKTIFFIRKYIRQHNISTVIIGTAEITIVRNLCFFLPAINCTAIVHNAKKLEHSFTFSKILSRKIKQFLVLGNYLLRELKPDPVFSIASFYPVYFPRPKRVVCSKPAGECWVTIPGGVSELRREYIPLLTALQTTRLDAGIKIIFLGKLYKVPEILELLQKTGTADNTVKTFDDYLDYDTFHSYMLHSDLMLPLLKFDDSDFYSNKRISGSFNLGLGYHIPFLLSSNYKQNDDLSPFSIYYDTMEELITTINKIARDSSAMEAIKNRYTSCNYCSIEAQADYLSNFIIHSS